MIVDANVALKWVLPQHDNPAASALLHRQDLVAPSNILLECAHALTRAARRREITADQARSGVASVARGVGRIVNFETLLGRALDLSLEIGATSHDCVYLALAVEEDDVFVTADMRFVRNVRARGSYVMRVKALSEV